MSRRLTVATFAVLALATPAIARACMCVVKVSAGAVPSVTPWVARNVVFVGTALTVELVDSGAVVERSRWVVEASWRGAMRDTVTLQTGRGCPGAYFAGSRYLVFADRIDSLVTAGPCNGSWHMEQAATQRMLADLGTPTWRPDPYPRRAFDAGVIGIGQAPPSGGRLVRLGLGGAATDSLVSAVAVADRVWHRVASTVPSFEVPEGVYRVRITRTTGDVIETYVEARCEQRAAEQCSAFRFLSGHGGSLVTTPGANASPASVAFLRLNPGATVRVWYHRERIDGAFTGWSGDTLLLRAYGTQLSLDFHDIDRLAVRAPSPWLAVSAGAVGGGIGAVLGHHVGGIFGSCGTDCSGRSTASVFVRGMLIGAPLALIVDQLAPRFHSLYKRVR